jgi:hypothetical protein
MKEILQSNLANEQTLKSAMTASTRIMNHQINNSDFDTGLSGSTFI